MPCHTITHCTPHRDTIQDDKMKPCPMEARTPWEQRPAESRMLSQNESMCIGCLFLACPLIGTWNAVELASLFWNRGQANWLWMLTCAEAQAVWAGSAGQPRQSWSPWSTRSYKRELFPPLYSFMFLSFFLSLLCLCAIASEILLWGNFSCRLEKKSMHKEPYMQP